MKKLEIQSQTFNLYMDSSESETINLEGVIVYSKDTKRVTVETRPTSHGEICIMEDVTLEEFHQLLEDVIVDDPIGNEKDYVYDNSDGWHIEVTHKDEKYNHIKMTTDDGTLRELVFNRVRIANTHVSENISKDEKVVIIINGNGGCGKDTLCDFVAEKYATKNISSITPIKEIAYKNGWHGEKTEKSRKFLSDMKKAFTEYNDLPYNYLMEEYNKFLDDDSQILFVHIREGEEIDKFKQSVDTKCITLLIRRDTNGDIWGNPSDDHVEDYYYDHIYNNYKPLEEASDDFIAFLNKFI